jgi:hypothetical protein
MSNGERFARGADRGVESRIEGARKTGETVEGPRSRSEFSLTPIKDQLVADLTEAAQTVRDRDKLKAVAQRKLDAWKQSITGFLNQRTDDQLDDAGEFTANAAIDAAIGAATGTLGRTSEELAEGTEKVGKAGKRARQVEGGVAEHAMPPRKASSPGKMQQEVKRNQAPRDVKRVDPAHTDAPDQEPHVHFCDGTACNQSGTTHDKGRGTPAPSKEARQWLTQHGWTPPLKE